ncbi:hypothetical protein IRY61_05405 [Candidatus Saccharibacteria bacterium]|nr:hypothetical protein [Candidatus Saccharibacteria bacterium]
MRLSNERIKSLQALMRKKHGLELTDEQAQEAGFAILRFVIAKAQREQELTKSEGNNYGKPSDTKAK